MIAVSLNVGGGILLMCTQKHNKHNKDGRMTPDVRSHGSLLLSPALKNAVTRIGVQQRTTGDHRYEKKQQQAVISSNRDIHTLTSYINDAS